MLKLTLRSFFDRKIRLALTTFAVLLGVSFVSGSFVLADSLRAVFNQVADEIGEPISVRVRSATGIDDADFFRPSTPAEQLELLRGVDGVAAASGVVEAFPNVSDPNGDLIAGQGPTLAYNFEHDAVSSVEIVGGSPPGPGQIAIDVFSAERFGIHLGDSLNVRSLEGAADMTVVGLAKVSDDDFGAIFVFLETATAQQMFGFGDAYSYIDVQGELGISADDLAARVQDALPAGFEAVTGEVIAEEFSAAFDLFISIFQNILLTFAAVALVVSAFIINNTFSIVLGQRIKELGLLRCLGASGKQVRSSVLLEALLIGGVASVAGTFGGLGVASLINQLVGAATDGGFPSGPVILSARTWIAALVVGVGVTLLASLAPARRAASIPPIAALSDDFVLSAARTRRRLTIGLVFGVGGLVAVLAGVFGSAGTTATLTLLGAGALALFVAVALLSTQIAAPVARLVGAPISRIGRIAGTLARNNAARNPHRTASTAAALMVGLALVTMVLVVGTSLKQTVTSLLRTAVTADYFVTPPTLASPGFSPQVTAQLSALDEVELAIDMRGGPGSGARARIGGAWRDIVGVPQVALGTLIHAGFTDGGPEGLSDDGLAVHKDPAAELGLSAGDTVAAEFSSGERELTVVGVFDDASIVGNWVVDTSVFEQVYSPNQQVSDIAMVSIAAGVEVEAARPAIEAVIEDYPEVEVRNNAEFNQQAEDRLNQLLTIVNALLAFAVIIAALGVVNTLVLSVFERTREIGLLRAVGMTRRQTRRMIRWEAVIVAVFGGILGVALGLALGAISVAALPESFVSQFGVPVGQLVMVLVLCVVMGLVAAILPARRAARMDVLQAIYHA